MAGKAASDDAALVAVEQPAADEAVSKALEHVSKIVENVAKAMNLPAPTTPAAAPAAAPAAPAAAPAAVETTEASLLDIAKAMGATDEEDAKKKLKAAGFDPNQKFPTAKPPVAKTTKAAEPAGDVNAIDEFVDLITKAKKFTPGRVAALKTAAETLKALLDDIEEIPQGTMPGVSPGGSTQFGASGVKVLTEKSASKDEQILAALTELNTVVKSLQTENAALKEKVESVSKARQPSASLEGEGGTETKVAKSSLWSGIL